MKNNYVLYCSTSFNGVHNYFIIDFPAKDKKLAQLWTIDDWSIILKLCNSRASLMDSLENVKESIGYMKRFSDIRKLSSSKQNNMKSEIRTVSENLRDAINFANSKASEYQVFNA